MEYTVKPQKKTLGIWFNCKRTLLFSLLAAVDLQESNGNWFTTSEIIRNRYSEYEWKLTGTINIDTYTMKSNFMDFHFHGFRAWGDSPDTDKAIVLCIPNDF